MLSRYTSARMGAAGKMRSARRPDERGRAGVFVHVLAASALFFLAAVFAVAAPVTVVHLERALPEKGEPAGPGTPEGRLRVDATVERRLLGVLPWGDERARDVRGARDSVRPAASLRGTTRRPSDSRVVSLETGSGDVELWDFGGSGDPGRVAEIEAFLDSRAPAIDVVHRPWPFLAAAWLAAVLAALVAWSAVVLTVRGVPHPAAHGSRRAR
jgi:hypothetical protein